MESLQAQVQSISDILFLLLSNYLFFGIVAFLTKVCCTNICDISNCTNHCAISTSSITFANNTNNAMQCNKTILTEVSIVSHVELTNTMKNSFPRQKNEQMFLKAENVVFQHQCNLYNLN